MVLSNSFLLKFLLPLVAEQLLAILVGLADTLMASSICESAVDAISIVDQVFIFINILLSSFASGGVILVSRFFGAKNFPTLKKNRASPFYPSDNLRSHPDDNRFYF